MSKALLINGDQTSEVEIDGPLAIRRFFPNADLRGKTVRQLDDNTCLRQWTSDSCATRLWEAYDLASGETVDLSVSQLKSMQAVEVV
jgi:hypothetical protein